MDWYCPNQSFAVASKVIIFGNAGELRGSRWKCTNGWLHRYELRVGYLDGDALQCFIVFTLLFFVCIPKSAFAVRQFRHEGELKLAKLIKSNDIRLSGTGPSLLHPEWGICWSYTYSRDPDVLGRLWYIRWRFSAEKNMRRRKRSSLELHPRLRDLPDSTQVDEAYISRISGQHKPVQVLPCDARWDEMKGSTETFNELKFNIVCQHLQTMH